MALVMYNSEGKKRCLRTNAMGLQCTKRRNHVKKEIDVVHQAGMFIWRNDGASGIRLGKSDLIRSFGIQSSTQSERLRGLKDGEFKIDFRFPPPFDDSKCTCVICRTKNVVGSPAQEARKTERMRMGSTASQIIFDEAATLFNTSTADGIRDEPITATPEQQLTEWWTQQAEDEIARTVPKAIEYSAIDLQDIGHDLARTMGREVSDEEAAELGVFFYLRGKVARWVGAVMAGKQVSDDTLFDIGVYVRMAQRIREFGGWPGVKEESNGS